MNESDIGFAVVGLGMGANRSREVVATEGARLIADDQTELCVGGGALTVRAPVRLAGKLEVRGLGLADVPSLDRAPLVLVADLVAANDIERLPEARSVNLAGIDVAMVRLAPFEVSATAKLRLAVRTVSSGAFDALDKLALP